jgi:hypothetical protein
LTTQQDQSTVINQNNKYTTMMKEYLAFKDQTENFVQKLDNQGIQKETTVGRINELRFILDQYKEELREYGVDPEVEILKVAHNNNQPNKKGKKGEEEGDPMQKRAKELQDRMNELRRWHNSK